MNEYDRMRAHLIELYPNISEVEIERRWQRYYHTVCDNCGKSLAEGCVCS